MPRMLMTRMCFAQLVTIAVLLVLPAQVVISQTAGGTGALSGTQSAADQSTTDTPARFPPPQSAAGSQAPANSAPDQSDAAASQNDPASNTPADNTTTANSSTARLKEQIVARQEQLLASEQSLDPELFKRLGGIYTQTLAYLAAAESAETQSAQYLEQIAGAADALSEINQQIVDFTPSHLRDDLTINDLRLGKEQLQQLNLALSAATAEVERLEAEQARHTKRRQEIPGERSTLSAELDKLRSAALPSDNGSDALGEANRWQAEANVLAAEAQLKMLERELQAYDALGSLTPQQLALARGVGEDLRESVKIVSAQLESLRSDQIQQAKYDTLELLDRITDEETAKQVSELLSKIDKWQELASQHSTVETEVAAVRETLEHWRGRLTNMRTLENEPGQAQGEAFTTGGSFNSWVGLMLRRQLDELPSTAQLAREIRNVDEQLRAARATQFSLQDSQRDVLRSKREIQRLYLNDSTIEDVSKLKPAVGQSWESLLRRESVLAAMKVDVDEFIDSLLQLATTRQQLIDLTKDYREFIDRHILWIRSAEPLASTDLSSAIEAAQWLCDGKLLQLAKLIAGDAAGYPWWYALFAISIGVLVANRAAMLRLIKQLGNEAAKKSCSKFQLTARALLLTALVACPLALVLLFAHWRLLAISNFDGISIDAQEYARALSQGLLASAWVLFPLAFLRQVCRDTGVGVKHFGWPKSICESLHRNITWLLIAGLPLVFVIHTLSAQPDSRRETSLGRLTFIALMFLLSWFLYRVLRRSRPAPSSPDDTQTEGWFDRTRWIWSWAVIVAPIAIAVAAAVGFYYTAGQIAINLDATAVALVLLAVVHGALSRWLLLNRRKLILSQARARLEEAARRDTSVPAVSESADLNMVSINEQTHRLVMSALVATSLVIGFWIWSDVLPAIKLLNSVVIWEVAGDEGQDPTKFTLANLVLVVPILVLTIICGRNVPGLLEIGLLQHLPLTSAARYATTTLCRYFIFAVGIVVAGTVVGLEWTSIQWLVAALGVGLGFGLQEIFANFVSGVILLFEQPLRVGDIITIDGTTGTVSKIRMRATTIVNWDRQELIVPNKDLITGKLLNWTLSDTTNRIVVNVGVAYGSDIETACDIVRDICEQHDNVMSDPAPLITFEGFGDNTLNITVRAFLSSLENRLATVHELHQRIYRRFAESDIEIAFPQRDLHLRSLPEKLSRWLDADGS